VAWGFFRLFFLKNGDTVNWKDLHNKSTVVDLHSHPSLKSSLFRRDIGSPKKRLFQKLKLFQEKFWPFSGRVTFPMLDKGGVDVLLSTAYTLEKGWIDDMSLIRWLFWLFPSVRKTIVNPTYFQATLNMLDDMEKSIERYNNNRNSPDFWNSKAKDVRLVKTNKELKKSIRDGAISIVHSVEGAHSLQGEIAGKIYTGDLDLQNSIEVENEVMENLDALYNRGVAYLGLAHFYPNRCVYPVFPYPEYGSSHLDWRNITGEWDETKGLTKLGEKVVEKMLELGMLIDISHCTYKARKRIYDIVSSHRKTQCLLSSHTGAFEVNRLSYNLQDWELKWMSDNGCVVGVIFMNYWISSVDSGLGLKYIEQTLNHILNVCGGDTPAIGTDFDGFTDPPDELIDASEMPRLTCYLKGLGYTDETVEKFLGKNAMRLLMNGWKKR